MTSLASAADRPLYRWELICVLALLPLFIGFGYVTVWRSAYADDRMTDFGVYTRTAWAVRTGQDPYEIADDRKWHYTYPPPFVVTMLPFADPPEGADRTGYLPFAVSVGIWYAMNVLLAGLAAHLFALAVLPDARRFSRRWWYARLIPFDVCLPAIGYTLGRGQVNVFVLALLAGGFLAAARRRGFTSGLLIAAATCVKVIPGLLVLFPLVRRQWRELAGLIAGAVLFLYVVPALVWGPVGAWEKNVTFLREVVFPGLTSADGSAREKELLATTATDSQAFHAIIHAIRHPDRATRPANSDGLSKGLHYLIGLGMLAATVWAFRPLLLWRSRVAPGIQPETLSSRGEVRNLLFFGCLCVLMIHLAPASHMHYYAFVLPLIAGLVADDLHRHSDRAVPTLPVLTGLIGWVVLTTVPLVDTWSVTTALRDFGLPVWATVGLWAWSVVRLSNGRTP